MFNVSDNYNYVGPLPSLRYYAPNGVKEPLRTQMIEWHKAHENNVFQIHEYCKADVQLLKSGCIMCRNDFSQIPVYIRFRVGPLQLPV